MFFDFFTNGHQTNTKIYDIIWYYDILWGYHGDLHLKIHQFPLKASFETTSPSVAPGFVESFAFGGEAPKKQSGGEGIAVGEPSAPWALPYAVGTSDLATQEGFQWNNHM